MDDLHWRVRLFPTPPSNPHLLLASNAYRGKQCYKTSNEQGEEEQQAQDEDELTGVDESQLYPVWCFDRFGQSMTILPDGRRIFIAGEHEDWYDPDFFIYNDVVVISTNGDIEHIFGYPIEVFPPTDFHAAAYVPTQNGRCCESSAFIPSLLPSNLFCFFLSNLCYRKCRIYAT